MITKLEQFDYQWIAPGALKSFFIHIKLYLRFIFLSKKINNEYLAKDEKIKREMPQTWEDF